MTASASTAAETTTVDRHEKISDLISLTKHQYMNLMSRLYDEAKLNNKANKFILRDFQNTLKIVSTWSSERKRDECEKFDLDAIEVLLNQIIATNSILFKVPDPAGPGCTINPSTFVFENALNVAREVWTKPFLLYHRVNKQEYQKNMMSLEKVVINEIKTTVRKINKIAQAAKPAYIVPQCLAPNGYEVTQAHPVPIVVPFPAPTPTPTPATQTADMLNSNASNALNGSPQQDTFTTLDNQVSNNVPDSPKSVYMKSHSSLSKRSDSDSDSESDDSEESDTYTDSDSITIDSSSNETDDDVSTYDKRKEKNVNRVSSDDEKVVKVVKVNNEDDRQFQNKTEKNHHKEKSGKTKGYEKRGKKYKKNSMQTYQGYLNPYLYSPKKK